MRDSFIKRYEDYECWLNVLEHTGCVYLNERLVYYDTNHGGGKNY